MTPLEYLPPARNERGPVIPVVSTPEAIYCDPHGVKPAPHSGMTGNDGARVAAAKKWAEVIGVSQKWAGAR